MNDTVRTTADAGGESVPGHAPEKRVKHFRQILLWPVHLLPLAEGAGATDHGALLAVGETGNPWRAVEDEFASDPGTFEERHYNEFVTFLPPVQRFLYGQGIGKSVRRGYGESPIRVMRRSDVAALSVTLAPDTAPVRFEVAHVDLYFFFDIDIAMLAIEIFAEDLPLSVAEEAMFRIGRAYPAYWEGDGRGGHCPVRAEWLSPTGEVLAASDYDSRAKFLAFVGTHRAPAIAAHWDYLMRPLVLHQSDRAGALRYRLLEYYRMPLMAYLAMTDPRQLTGADHVRLAMAKGADKGQPSPEADRDLAALEAKHPFDVYEAAGAGVDWTATRYSVSGYTFVVTGDAGNRVHMDTGRGYLGRFRHQHFLLFLIAHFHRAALLMFTNRLALTVSQLDVANASSVRAFHRQTRAALETFLRFTHRYWFHEVSEQAQNRTLFELCRSHLGLDRLYADVRQELEDMSVYLENETLRRQNGSMVRLTVVTTFGLIGTVTTGLLGMNLFDWAGEPPGVKLLLFAVVLAPVTILTLYTVKKSARLSQFLDALSDEWLDLRAKLRAFARVWRR
ncbi:MAG: hypothetical protein EXQ87_00165 [Alphaproteobacteria bacterium]|nr:hypothetical protein [Alphaproteobacteria bacterium]